MNIYPESVCAGTHICGKKMLCFDRKDNKNEANTDKEWVAKI